MSKLLFFDIDGTLIGRDGTLPASTLNALHKAQQKGHQIFLSTGRCVCQIQKELLDVGFDGLVASAGAYGSIHGDVIYQHFFENAPYKELIRVLDEEKICYLIQSEKLTASTQRCLTRLEPLFKNEMHMDDKWVNRVIGQTTVDESIQDRTDVEKIVYYDSKLTLAQLRERISSDFVVTPYSFGKSGEDKAEITWTGIGKSTAMEKIAAHLGLGREDVIAFGDGYNDMDMMEYAGCAVAMGNAIDEIKEISDFITKDQADDGIAYALKELSLI